MHAVERAGHRRAQESAVVLELIEPQREDAALLADGGFDLGDAVGTGAGGEEMLEPVLDPFDRPAGDARGQRGQHDVGKDRELDAEAAAAVGRDAQPQLRPGDAQGARHHRVGAERALKIRQHVVALLGGPVFGHDDVAFHRGERVAGIFAGQRDPGIGLLERGFDIAVGKSTNRNLVGPGFGVQQRRRFGARGLRVDYGRERLIVDAHEFGRVLGEVAGVGDHERDRLADIAYALDRERPLMHRRLERDQERVGQLADILAGDDRPDAVLRERFAPHRCRQSWRAHAATG